MKYLNYFLLSLVACLFLGVTSAFAVEKGDNEYGVMELNKDYVMEGNNVFWGTFTPTETGYLQVYSNHTNTIRPYKTWQGSVMATMKLADNGFVLTTLKLKDNYCFNYEIPVTAGTTYYMCGSTLVGENITFHMEMKPKSVEFLNASEDENAVISPTETSSISFYFNRAVIASSAAILYGDNKMESVTSRASSSACSVSAEVKSALVNLAAAGKMKTGDEFTVVLKGIKEDTDEAGVEPIEYGDVSMKFKLGDLPAMLENATMDGLPITANTKFLTYYAPGTGVMVMNFSKPLDEEEGAAILRFGDSDQSDNGGYYQEKANDKAGANFKMTVKGSQVILDFSGKRRAVSDMVSSTESNRGVDFSKINLEVSKITDLDGVKAYTTTSTTNGKFNYSFSLDVPEANVSSEFTPENGASIKNEQNVEIWIGDEQSLSYQGVVFTYDLQENGIEPTPDADGNVDIIKEVVVDMKDIQREADEFEEGAFILTVPIPEEVKNMNNVVVSLYKVTCVDGKDYSNTVAAKYNVAATGIADITVEGNQVMKVYNLNGQLVRESKSLKGLQGIYVVNGKKVVLK